MALAFLIIGILGLTISLSLVLTDTEFWKSCLVIALVSLMSISIPFIGNSYTKEPHSLLTNEWEGITYDKVVKVDYMLYKTDKWWAWTTVAQNEKREVKISFEY